MSTSAATGRICCFQMSVRAPIPAEGQAESEDLCHFSTWLRGRKGGPESMWTPGGTSLLLWKDTKSEKRHKGKESAPLNNPEGICPIKVAAFHFFQRLNG